MVSQLSSDSRGGGTAARGGVIVNGPLGRFKSTHGLTQQQSEFVRHFVANGGKRREAARSAGYRDFTHEGCRLLNLPHIREAIRAERDRTIECQGACGALKIMVALLGPDNPAAVQFQAAKWLLEASGFGAGAKAATSPTSRSGGPLCEMTVGELEAFVAQSSARLASYGGSL